MLKKLVLIALFSWAGVLAGTSICLAAEPAYPNRPVNMIIGFAPGGASDLAGQIISEKLSAVLGQPVLVTHKPGAGGIVAASYVRKSKPDGYNLLLLAPSMFLPTEVKKLDYTHDDFAFLTMFTRIPYFMCVQAQSRWKNLKDFIEDAKKSPGKITYGTTGTNVGGYFVAQLLSKHAGIKLTLVPFKSCGEAMTGLLGGHVDSFFCPGVGAVSEATLVRVLAIPEEKRLQGYEQVPTFSELGYPVLYSGGHALAVPKETPPEIVKKLSAAVKTTMEKYSSEIAEKLRKVELWAAYYEPPAAVRAYKQIFEVERAIIMETKAPEK